MMMNERQPTVQQHFVPQTYLRGFSSDKKTIYEFDLRDFKQIDRPIPIKSVCYQNDLYEIKDEDDNYVSRNHLENYLAGFENQYQIFFSKLNKKICPENRNTLAFLTGEEKTFWKIFIALQMVRIPEVISGGTEVVKDVLLDGKDSNQAKAIFLLQILPFFKELTPDDKNAFFAVLNPIIDMTIAVAVDPFDSLFTSDHPVYCFAPGFRNGVYEEITFCISTRLVFKLFNNRVDKVYKRNCLAYLSEDDVLTIKKSIAYSASRWIYSKKALTEKDLKIVKQARDDKDQDGCATNTTAPL